MISTQVKASSRGPARQRQKTQRLADMFDQGKSYADAPRAAPRAKRSSGPASKPPAAKKAKTKKAPAKKAPAKAPEKKKKRGRVEAPGAGGAPGRSLADLMERAKARRTEPPKPPAS